MSKVPVLPTPEQWKYIQGGEPQIIANEDATIFKVCHVYNDSGIIIDFEPDLAEKYQHYGMLVTTPVLQMNRSLREDSGLILGPERIAVSVPATLNIATHGIPCNVRSGGRGYEVAEDPEHWATFLEKRADENWDQWTLQHDQNGLSLKNNGLLSVLLN